MVDNSASKPLKSTPTEELHTYISELCIKSSNYVHNTKNNSEGLQNNVELIAMINIVKPCWSHKVHNIILCKLVIYKMLYYVG